MATVDDVVEASEESEILTLDHFEYPKPLPPVKYETTYDEMGLSDQEKLSLVNMWRYVKPQSRRHAINMFRVFFLRNENLIEKFRDANGDIQTSTLYLHAHTSLRMYGFIIENVLGNPAAYHSLTYKMLQAHKQVQIDTESIVLYGESLNEYLMYYVRKHTSPTLSKALEKLTLYIAKQHPKNNGTDERIAVSLGLLRKKLQRSTTLSEHLDERSEIKIVSGRKSKTSNSGSLQNNEAALI